MQTDPGTAPVQRRPVGEEHAVAQQGRIGACDQGKAGRLGLDAAIGLAGDRIAQPQIAMTDPAPDRVDAGARDLLAAGLEGREGAEGQARMGPQRQRNLALRMKMQRVAQLPVGAARRIEARTSCTPSCRAECPVEGPMARISPPVAASNGPID